MTVARYEGHLAIDEKKQYAQLVSASTLIPGPFRNRPEDVFVAVEMGYALGLAPIVALSEINVINGTPSLSAALMVSLARQAGHKIRTTGDNTHARCEITRADDPDFTHVAEWDIDKAKSAGLWGKGFWSKDPGTMLKWRAASEAVRFACPEVLAGLKYSAEEASDFGPSTKSHAPEGNPSAPPPTARLEDVLPPVVSADSQPEPVVEAEVVEPAAEVAAEKLASTRQRGELIQTIGTNMGITDKAQALAWFSDALGRDLASTGEITAAEAKRLLDELHSMAWAEGEVIDADGVVA